jgi:hypothetical protein
MLHKTNHPVDLSSIEAFDNNKWFAQVFAGGLIAILMLTVVLPLVTPPTVSGNSIVPNTNQNTKK